MSEIVRIATKAVKMMLREGTDPDLVLISTPGSSGARVSIFRHSGTNFLYAVKCVNNSRVSLMDEVARKAVLVPYLSGHMPNVLWCQVVDGYEVMISECKGLHNLHALIMSGDLPFDQLFGIWKNVIQSFFGMWEQSVHEFNSELCPRYVPARIQRVSSALQKTNILGDEIINHWEKPVVINGVEYNSIAKCFKTISNFGAPQFGVVCHGDPQPSNIVVGFSVDWYCIDWEWAGKHQDWRMMLSHLFGWWHSRCLILSSTPSIDFHNGVIEISYKASLPIHLVPFMEEVNILARDAFGASMTRIDTDDINRFISLLYFGELRFLNLWGREIYVSVLLAQAIIVASAIEGMPCNSQAVFAIGK